MRIRRTRRDGFSCNAGTCSVVFTDGLTDATDFDANRFGGTRLRRVLVELIRASRMRALRAGRGTHPVAVRQFCGLAPRSDDVTIVVVKVG